jgi:hypothetical protein
MPGRLDHVSIALDGRDVALTSDARWDLLARMERRPIGSPDQNETIIEAFRRVGRDRPVRLDADGKTHLLAVLQHWSFDTGRGYSGLPQGMLQLSNALRDDVHGAERRNG